MGGPFLTPEANYQENDFRSSANLQNKKVEGLGIKEKGFVPLPPLPDTEDRDLRDQDSDGAKANHLAHSYAMVDRLDLPLDTDPHIEELYFGDHDDLHDYPYDEDIPTHDLHFNDYNSHEPFPPRCKFEVSPSYKCNIRICFNAFMLFADASLPNDQRKEVREKAGSQTETALSEAPTAKVPFGQRLRM